MKVNVQYHPMPVANNFLQSPFWSSFKGYFHWESLTFQAEYYGGTYQFMVLLRRIGKLFRLAYVPLPAFDDVPEEDRQEFLTRLSHELLGFLPMGTFMIRWDLPWEGPLQSPLAKASTIVQPPDTTILNLRLSQEELLANMHKKTRYNIQLAQKKGVCVERAGFDELPKWYKIYEQTAQRDGIAIHNLTYYQKFFSVADQTSRGPEARLYLAWHEQDLLAGIITLFYRGRATYVYGASGSVKRNLMASYALQWRAICDAQQAGCTEYDFYGIPPAPDPEHPMAGLYQFKVGFGGAIVHRCGAWDYPYSKVLYPLFSMIERHRAKKLHAKKKHATPKAAASAPNGGQLPESAESKEDSDS